MDVALEQAELAAMRTQWGGPPGATVEHIGGLHVFAASGPPWLTQICGLGLTGSLDALDEALGRAPGALITVVDGTVRESELERRGYHPATRLLRLVAPARCAAPPALRMEVVGPEAASLVAAVAGRVFGMDLPAWWPAPLGRPGWTQLLAYDGAAPVATGGLHVADRLGLVGAAATLPEARGRGAQSALLAARLRIAQEQGAERVGVKVTPGSISHRNVLRAGFAPAHGLVQWEPA